jgi:hypothetical protein
LFAGASDAVAHSFGLARVSVKLVVGIPSPAVMYYALGYGGTFNGGVKCSRAVEIYMDVAGSASLSFPVPSWGATHRYKDEDAPEVAGDWYRSLAPGAQAIENGQLQRTVDNLNATFVELPDCQPHALHWKAGGLTVFNRYWERPLSGRSVHPPVRASAATQS